MLPPLARKLPWNFDFDAFVSRADKHWSEIVSGVPFYADGFELRRAYRRVVGAVFDEVDLYYSENLVARPFEVLTSVLADGPWSFEAFRRDVIRRGLYTLGSTVRGRLLSCGHALDGYPDSCSKIQLSNGVTALLPDSDFLWSNDLLEENEHLRQAISEAAQACRGLDIPLVMLSSLEDEPILVGRKFAYPHPFEYLRVRPYLAFNGTVLQKNRTVAQILMNVNWGKYGHDPFAHVTGVLPRSDCHWQTWCRLRPGTQLRLQPTKYDVERQQLQFAPASAADCPEPKPEDDRRRRRRLRESRQGDRQRGLSARSINRC